MKTLNLGAGSKKMSDEEETMDIDPLINPDHVHDLNQYPWPIKDNTYEKIYASHILEHLTDLPQAMKQIHRILKPHGTLVLTCPYAQSFGAYVDPTHVHYVIPETFESYFTLDGPWRRIGWENLFEWKRTTLKKNKALSFLPGKLLRFVFNGITEFEVTLTKPHPGKIAKARIQEIVTKRNQEYH